MSPRVKFFLFGYFLRMWGNGARGSLILNPLSTSYPFDCEVSDDDDEWWWWWWVMMMMIDFWSFDFPESYIYYSLGIYLNRYKRKMCRTNVLWVCKFGQVGRFLPQISKSPYYDDFFQNWPSQWRSSRVFLRWNFRSDFFLFRFIFKGISYIKCPSLARAVF